MAGVVLETLSTKKLSILSVSLAVILLAFFLIGGLIAPSPNSVIPAISVKCVDTNETWQFGQMKPILPRGKGKCFSVNSLHSDDPMIKKGKIKSNMVVFSQWLPLPRENMQLDMSRWFQSLISVLQVDVSYSSKFPYPEEKRPKMELEASLYYRDKEDDENDWKLLAASRETRNLDCSIKNDERKDGNYYNCDLLPFFELGSVHYDYYLINFRLPVYPKSDVNQLGQIEDISVVTIYQNGGFTKVWFSMKTVMFPVVLAMLVWFWHRVVTQGRSTNLMERTLFALGIILSIMNCPLEWLTLVVNIPFMMLLNDIRDGAFYAMLMSFWIIFVGEHMMEQMERNKLSSYWKEMLVVICGCSALFVFEMCERGTQLKNPFYSIWSTDAGATAALGFIIVAGISACVYFIFLCYCVFKVFRTIRLKRNTLLSMSSVRRKYYTGIIYRFKFLMVVTLLCAALTVISFIIGQVYEGQWKWGDEDVSLEYTSAFLTGVYGMWNVYVISLLSLYAPSHKKYASDEITEPADSNSREEEVQLTQMPSDTTSTLAGFVAKSAAD